MSQNVQPSPGSSSHRPFILVPGAFHGGWCWQRVTPLLQAAGAVVYTPSLTGLGERSHLIRCNTDIHTHVADICNVIDWEGLGDVILVGHSYGGTVVSGVAQVMPERLAQLVYLDSTNIFPGNDRRYVGKSLPPDLVQLGPDKAMAIPPPTSFVQWGVVDPADCSWLARCLTPHPYLAKVSTFPIDEERLKSVARSYIACLQRPQQFTPVAMRKWAKNDPEVNYYEMDTGHDAMVLAPKELAELLLEIRDR